MRDENIKKAFIAYLQNSDSERFFQALTNFTKLPYIGAATSPNGNDFRDLWHVEADERIQWLGKGNDLRTDGPDTTEGSSKAQSTASPTEGGDKDE